MATMCSRFCDKKSSLSNHQRTNWRGWTHPHPLITTHATLFHLPTCAIIWKSPTSSWGTFPSSSPTSVFSFFPIIWLMLLLLLPKKQFSSFAWSSTNVFPKCGFPKKKLGKEFKIIPNKYAYICSGFFLTPSPTSPPYANFKSAKNDLQY